MNTSKQSHLKLVEDYSIFAGLLRKLSKRLPQSSFTTICKSFLRPHLDYGDVMFDKAYNNSFQQRLESLQYKASLAITGALKVLLLGSFIKS